MASKYRYPFPAYPAGWYEVAYAEDLAPGQVKAVRAFGQELAVFRTARGAVHALDAYCPHLGAHMGHGGQVEGEQLVCPFHRWTFDGTGACTSIPYSARRIPTRAKVDCWPVVERNNAILVWYSPDRSQPSFEIPIVEEVGHPDWSPQWSIDRTVRFHCQEIRENGVDAYHFNTVHGLPPNTLSVRAEGHILVQESSMKVPQTMGDDLESTLRVDFYGLGYAVARHRMPGLETLVVSHITPIDEEQCRMRFAVSQRRLTALRSLSRLGRFYMQAQGDINDHGVPVRPSLKRMLSAIPHTQIRRSLWRSVRSGRPRQLLFEVLTQMMVLPTAAELARQLDQDIYITERKIYLDRPLYRDGEKPIHQLRRWARQFYPEMGEQMV